VGQSGTRVLVVDDERFFREAIAEILTANGFESECCEDGETAIEVAAAQSFGVVVLDIRLPGMDGIEVLRRLRESSPNLRVIMLSASTDQELVLEALRLGACDYLAKPLHDEELALAVGRAAASFSVAHEWADLRCRMDRLVDLMEALTENVDGAAPGEREGILRQGAAAAVAEVLEARKTSLMLLNDESQLLEVVAVTGRDLDPTQMDSVQLGRGVAGQALECSAARVVERIGSADDYTVDPDPERYETESFAVAPLEVADRRIGVLCASDREDGGSFGAEDLSLLRLISLQVAELMAVGRGSEHPVEEEPLGDAVAQTEDEPVSLEFAREVADAAEICENASDLDAELARQICDAVINELEPEAVLRAAIRSIERALQADPVSIYLLDNRSDGSESAGGPRLRLEALGERGLRGDLEELRTDRGLTGVVFQTGHLIATADPAVDPRFDPDVDSPSDQKSGALLCIPLQFRGKRVGLCRIHLVPGAAASARTGEVLVAVLSAAIRNVLLYRSLLESIEDVAVARREVRTR
jgi:FixJ family two-component response regulator